jgi:hypothetical protein
MRAPDTLFPGSALAPTNRSSLMTSSLTGRRPGRANRVTFGAWATAGVVAAVLAGGTTAEASVSPPTDSQTGSGTVWLCRPGKASNPCDLNRSKTVVRASGDKTVVGADPDQDSPFDCFYVYPTVSKEPGMNADLEIQKEETDVAMFQASRFSQTCQVWAPMYRQNTHAAFDAHPDLNLPAASAKIAYDSVASGFGDYLLHYNHGRPIVFLGHSQGAAILIKLLSSIVDHNPPLRSRVAQAVLLGGDVETSPGSTTGGSFTHLPICARTGQAGCVIAYSSFPSTPPATALFGRPGQGVALQSGQTAKTGVQVACVNPAAISGGAAALDPFFLGTAKDAVTTPWIEYPGLYSAQCEKGTDGSAWLQVTKTTGPADQRPIVTVAPTADYGYHLNDPNLALGDLVTDVAAAETTWLKTHH